LASQPSLLRDWVDQTVSRRAATKVRVLNVVDLMRLQRPGEHPHGVSDMDCDLLFTRD
jgi:phosphoketolase